MMRSYNFFLVLLGAIFVFSGGRAIAETSSFVAEQGKHLVIGGGYNVSQDNCNYVVLPKVKVTMKPAHGQIDIWDYPFDIPGDRPCGGTHSKIRHVVYTPFPGFHGQDHVKFDIQVEKGTSQDPNQAHNAVTLTVP